MTDLRKQLVAAIGRQGRPSSDFDLNPDGRTAGRQLTPAAVLVGVLRSSGSVVLTTRSARLKHHPGQVAFPGGKVDPTDASPVAAALREAQEEIGMPSAAADVLGTLAPHETVTGFSIVPVVALLDDFDPRAEAGEVSEVFHVPLSHLMHEQSFMVQSRYWQGRERRYYTAPYGPYYIWGATARILRGLADRWMPQ